MKVENIAVGHLKTNCYLIINDNDCLVVDPGEDAITIRERIGTRNVLGILITHYHPDHIGALDAILNYYKAPIFDFKSNIDINQVGPFTFKIIENKGHTSDSVTFYFESQKVMFVGDFIFKGTIGRTDLPTGDYNEMTDSLLARSSYDKDITLFPGHGSSTTLGYEVENNKHFKNIKGIVKKQI